MERSIANVPYLGRRNYVHGTTLFGLLKPRFAGGGEISFKISRPMIGNEVEIVVLDGDPESASSFACVGHWKDARGSHRIGIRETGRVDASLRAAFPEEQIVADAQIDAGGTARLAAAPSCEFIEAAVALNKAMVQTVYPLAPGEQYLFTRIDLERLPQDFLPLQLRLAARLADAHFVTQVRVRDVALGKLYFSKWNKLQ